MLEYPVDEAIALLTGKLASAKSAQAELKADLEYLLEQQTTTELSLPRGSN